ncbi:N protein [Almendravirus arboretum]|uniref:Nucleoprotein n=1 Tax=Almendravirus arboretum TaxID=1972683 RepID=X4QGP3_9RHAB|nr:N protein [Almendravirus arboretum]AHU86495.1 N protein [Almendravirus arboretum]
MEMQKIYIVKNGISKTVDIPVISNTDMPDDPSVWLKQSHNVTLNVKKSPKVLNELQLRRIICNGIKEKLNLDTVIYYLVHFYLKEFSFTPMIDWKINKDITFTANIKYTMAQALEIREEDEVLDTGDWAESGEPTYTQLGLIGILLSVYRYNNVSRGQLGNYQENLKKSMATLLMGEPFNVELYPDNIVSNSSWLNNKNYKMICAISDMFFNKFPTEEISKLKITTVSARYKDCAIISDINHAKKIFSMTDAEFYPTLLEPSITNEMVNYLEKLSKLPIEYAIVPYVKELGGMNKSPFSALMSPNTHNYIHMVGGYHGYQRSINSRLFEDSNLPAVSKYAVNIAFKIRDNLELMPVFATNDRDRQNFIENSLRRGVESGALTPQSIGAAMVQYIEDKEYQAEVDSWAREKASKIIDPREGSVGRYLVTLYGTVY